MNNLIQPKENYDFSNIKIGTPKPLQGGTYLAKIFNIDEPVIFQTPKSNTKKGIHKTEKKIYCDLLFDVDDYIFLEWIRNLEDVVRKLIYDKKDQWFYDTDLSLEDIEYNWIDTIKNYKKKFLCRTFVDKSDENLQIYGVNEEKLNKEDLTPEKKIVSILEINGLKFNSSSFHLEIKLRQVMVLENTPIFNKCLIQINKKEASNESKKSSIVLENAEEDEEKDTEEMVEKVEVVKKTEDDDQVEEDDELEKNVEKEEEVTVIKKEVNEENNNIKKEVSEEINKIDNESTKTLEKSDNLSDLKEHVLEVDEKDSMSLKNPNEIYLDIYRAARQKAKEMKIAAIKAHLEAKKIKQTYLVDEIDSSDDSDYDEDEDDIFSEN